ncbi:hypothetical protein KHU50_007014 [Colletotrichum sp. SAR 10_65]|nr:hypothetical protein KHU50_007014 [Colletotrichum sp. SAR 10_65]
MKTFSVIVAVIGAPSLVSAAICNNNCGRAVAGTARQNPPFAARQSLCEAFVSATVTVTPGAVTVTANPVARRNVHAPRQAAPIITGAVPAYASACADASAYWSAYLLTTETPSPSSATPVESSSSTTPSADGTTVSVGSTCTPTPILPSPTTLISAGDDTFGSALLPFPVGAFGSNATTVYASSNGFLSLYEGSTAYDNEPLPSDEIPPVSILPFWDDLRIQSPSQAVQYQVFGSDAGSRNVTFEWVAVHLGQSSQFYHFTATFEEAQPGIVTYRYYTTYDQGESATVGVQNLRNGNNFSVQVGYNSLGSVPDRTFLRLDTTGAGTFTTGAFETTEC